MTKKEVRVQESKPYTRKSGWEYVPGYWRNNKRKERTNKAHVRNRRRTKKEIEQKGTRKEQKRRNIKKAYYNKPKTTKQTKIKKGR